MNKSSGRWGETDYEKGPVDLFPVEPTDEAFMRKMGLELRTEQKTT